MSKTVTLWVHWKQGDDLHGQIKHAEGHPVQALRNWADSLTSSAERIRQVAALLEGKPIEIHADTHHIGIHDLDEATAQKLVETGIASIDEFDELEEDDVTGPGEPDDEDEDDEDTDV